MRAHAACGNGVVCERERKKKRKIVCGGVDTEDGEWKGGMVMM